VLIVDRNAPLPDAIVGELVEPIAFWCSKIVGRRCSVESIEKASRFLVQTTRKRFSRALRIRTVEDILRPGIADPHLL
jgi:hypothetical protein